MKRLVGAFIGLYVLFTLARGALSGRSAAGRAVYAPTLRRKHWPFVSVIIPAWRDRSALETCLRSLVEVDYPDHEVIVVAGGPDGTYDAACAMASQNPRIQVIEQLPRGKNAALNQGVRLARAGVLVFMDADSEVSPQWLKGLVGALDGDVAASTGNYMPVLQTTVSRWSDLTKVYEYQVRNRVILQGSGGIAVWRETLEKIGPFPEERISSDWDLDARLALRDYRKVFAPGAIIHTDRPATLAEWWQNEVRWRRLHLRSLLRLKDGLLADPVPAAKHLYPYVAAWAAAALTASAAGAWLSRSNGLKQAVLLAWGGMSLLLVREMGPVASVMVFERSMRWLPIIPLAPAMTVMTWAACLIASLTRNRAALQFKGARHVPGRRQARVS